MFVKINSLLIALLLQMIVSQNIEGQSSVLKIEQLKKIKNVIGLHAQKGLFSGAVLIASKGEVKLLEYKGFANWELGVKNSKNTKFAIASLTKIITGILVEKALAEGKLNIQQEVNSFFPDFPKWQNREAITISQLLHHTSGIPHRVTIASEETGPITSKEVMGKIISKELIFKPGSK